MKRTATDSRERLRRAALAALRRARRAADRAGVSLSEWEGEFLQSVETRVDAFGSAFADPAKGRAGSALSDLQGVKLTEIVRKARGGAERPKRPWGRSGWKRRAGKESPGH